MKTPNQEQVWDKIAKKWQEYRQRPKPAIDEFLKGKEGKILDIGCGSGRHFIKSKNTEFYGIDFSKEMIKLAKKRQIAVDLQQSPASKIPNLDNFFDYAIFAAVLHCLTLLDRKKALKELHRVLKPKGKAIITVLSKAHKRVKNKPSPCLIPWTLENEKLQRYYYIYKKEELEKELKEAKFKITKSKEDNQNISIIVEK
jgi:ubiquinone/menaquinone biosynthesis C-methylase UbiE